MKKIVIIHQYGLVGGAGLSLYYIAKMLEDKYEVVIYCPENPSDLTEYLRERGLNVKTYSIPLGAFNYYSGGPSLFSRSFWRSLLLTRHRYKWFVLFRSENADIIMVNSMILCWLGKTIREAGTKSICFVRETLPKGIFGVRNNLVHKFLNNNFDGVFFISDYDRKVHNLNQPVTAVIRDCVNETEFIYDLSKEDAEKSLGLKMSNFNMLFVGGIDPIKGLDVAIRALGQLKNMDLKLIIAGYCEKFNSTKKSFIGSIRNKWRNRYYKKIHHLIEKYDLKEMVSFIGMQKNISVSLSVSDIVLFPSIRPHQARPVFEAGIYKKPVIISAFEATSEHVIDNVNGLCFTPGNYIDLANKILTLHNNRELTQKLGLENFQMTINKHSYFNIAQELENNIEEILERQVIK